MTPLPAEKLLEGEFCLAPSDDEVYYRALIMSVDESSGQAHILYVDYGDENDINLDAVILKYNWDPASAGSASVEKLDF